MRIHKLLIFLFLLISANSNAQKLVKLAFKEKNQTLRRASKAVSYPITILKDSVNIPIDELNLYTVTVEVNMDDTTLPKSGYNLEFTSVSLDKIPAAYNFFITLKPDTLTDRRRLVYLYLELTKKDEKDPVMFSDKYKTHDIFVEGMRTLEGYNYLGYLGTNFDLIDGVKAKDLFFALNVVAPPTQRKKNVGFIISLYGNRTLSTTDTSGIVLYTSGYGPVGGDSVAFYKAQAQKTITSVSDNLGAMFTPMLRIWGASDGPNSQLYYGPQFEFIWRRKEITTSYVNSVATDTTYRINPLLTTNRTIPDVVKSPSNVYDMYLGLAGLFLKHENEHISVRVQGSFGLNYSYIALRRAISTSGTVTQFETQYLSEQNWFCYARAYITEPISGLTFGAEVSNFLFDKERYRPCYNVTLSKAINLNALGSIFTPVATR